MSNHESLYEIIEPENLDIFTNLASRNRQALLFKGRMSVDDDMNSILVRQRSKDRSAVLPEANIARFVAGNTIQSYLSSWKFGRMEKPEEQFSLTPEQIGPVVLVPKMKMKFSNNIQVAGIVPFQANVDSNSVFLPFKIVNPLDFLNQAAIDIERISELVDRTPQASIAQFMIAAECYCVSVV